MGKIYRLREFLAHDIWRMTNEDVKGFRRWLINALKAVWLSVRFFTAHRTMERASALTYYSLLAVVPAIALLLAIGRGFGLQDLVDTALHQNLLGQEAIVEYISSFAESYLYQAKSSVIMGVGVVMLLFVIFSLIGNIENVFNEIWQQKQSRSTQHKVTDYISIIVLLPIFFIVVTGAQIFLQTYISTDLIHYSHELSATLLWILRWVPYLMTILMLTFLYIVIPNCKVKFIHAITAALVAGTAFMAFQWVFISGQIWVTKYNAIYGSFSALPIFLLWIQTAWIICLYGAELSYASQNISNYNFENLSHELSRRDHDFLLILIAAHIYRCRKLHIDAPTHEDISRLLRLPSRITGELLSELETIQIIHSVPSEKNTEQWFPLEESDCCTMGMLYDRLNTFGLSADTLKVNHADFFKKEWQIYTQMHETSVQISASLQLRDIPTEQFQNNEIKLSDTNSVINDDESK